MICLVYITKCIKNKNKGKHLQMGKRSKQPKVDQKRGVGFLFFKKLINPFCMTVCLPYIFSYQWVHKVYL